MIVIEWVECGCVYAFRKLRLISEIESKVEVKMKNEEGDNVKWFHYSFNIQQYRQT